MFVVLLLVGAATHHLLVDPRHWTESIVLGFDLGAAAFLASLVPLWREADGSVIRDHADANDANRFVVLLMTLLVVVVVMSGVAGELTAAGRGDIQAIVKLIGSLLLVWLFTNCVYALHYAHDYYSAKPETGGDRGGLDFSGEAGPAYSDFMYFAFTLGMTFQTSDTGVTTRQIRQVVLLHSITAFLFNIGVIAFIINTLSGS
jgi:uncharacterized membrane protein